MDVTKLRIALDLLSLEYSKGNLSIDKLEKACSNYKQAIGHEDDFDYELIVSKSIIDQLNGVEADPEISKAVIPGQTKVIDGVMYVYSKTKNGSKEDYDWHVVKKTKSGATVGRGAGLSDKSIGDKQKFVNDLFPKDLSSLKQVKALGGSTGAVLVEDTQGNQYVKKTVGVSPAEQVRSEYLANQLYEILGVRTPDYELYEEDDGNPVLLSRFIPGLKACNKYGSKDERKKLAESAMVDVLLANWDVYENDNTNTDTAGRVIRVDNGGCLSFRAQGKKKTFDGDVYQSYVGMMKYNSSIFDVLSEQDIKNQITAIKAKKDDIVEYLKEVGEDDLAKIMAKRIDNLKQIADEMDKRIAMKNHTVVPRTLKPEDEMYREFDEDEIDEFFKNATGTGTGKITHVGPLGWELISTIAHERGFDARPRVVDEDEYWEEIKKGRQQCFRGVSNAGGIYTVQYQTDHFKYNDDFFIGRYGIYGGGLYCHVNDADKKENGGGNANSTETGYKHSRAYQNAVSGYGTGSDDSVLCLALEEDFKLLTYEDAKKKLEELCAESANTDEVKKLKKELDKINADLAAAKDTLANLQDNVEAAVKAKMHYDEASVEDLQLTIDDLTDWGDLDDDGNYTFPKYDQFVLGNIVDWVKKNGGSVDERHGQVTLALPNSDETFTIYRYQWNMPSIIRRRNAMSKKYHLFAEQFKQWFITNHVKPVQNAIKEEVKTLGDQAAALNGTIKTLERQSHDKEKEFHDAQTPDVNNNIWHACKASLNGGYGDTGLGVVAAILGYDGIYVTNGNGCGNGFISILNRSKIIVKK